MCNRFALDDLDEISAFYGLRSIGSFGHSYILPTEITPRDLTVGLVQNLDGERELRPMQFAFCPPGCPTSSDPRRPYNNARIESAGKWPWDKSFLWRRCVLPLSRFREPSYWGPPAGTEVYFSRTDGAHLHVAGIYRVWKSPLGDEKLCTMAFLMRPASTYVIDHGHHRQPLFIDPGGIDRWIDNEPLQTTSEGLALLRSIAADPELTFEHVRDMAPAWTKRRTGMLAKRDETIAQIEGCPHACGF